MKKKTNEVAFDEFPVRIKPGEYDAVCYKAEYGWCFGRRSLYVCFRIINHNEYDGTELYMACAINKDKLSYRSKLFRQFTIVMGRHPKKGERLNKKIFVGTLFRVLVRDTDRKVNRKSLPESEQYSVVDTIIEPLTGDKSV